MTKMFLHGILVTIKTDYYWQGREMPDFRFKSERREQHRNKRKLHKIHGKGLALRVHIMENKKANKPSLVS